MLKNKEKSIRVNTRIMPKHDAYIKARAKKDKVYEGDVHREALDLLMKQRPL